MWHAERYLSCNRAGFVEREDGSKAISRSFAGGQLCSFEHLKHAKFMVRKLFQITVEELACQLRLALPTIVWRSFALQQLEKFTTHISLSSRRCWGWSIDTLTYPCSSLSCWLSFALPTFPDAFRTLDATQSAVYVLLIVQYSIWRCPWSFLRPLGI